MSLLPESTNSKVLSVSQLGELVKQALNTSFGTDGVWVKGVVASYSPHSSGHHYLDLQEFSELGSAAPTATLSCVIWRTRASYVINQLASSSLGAIRNGLSLVVRVKPNFWPKGGRLSFQIEEVDVGLSQIANLQEKEKIRAKLKELGIWDKNRKHEVALVPLNIGLITARSSAAESDFLGEIARSGFSFKVIYSPAATAGDAAPSQISRSLRLFEESDVDLICLVRGGGSMSDLAVFDTEEVVTAVAASSIPVWVGIGHSTDTTLVEEVANMFLDVPQSVARAVVNRVQEFMNQIDHLGQQMQHLGRSKVDLARLQLTDATHQAVRKPLELINFHKLRLSQQIERLRSSALLSTANARSEVSGLWNVASSAAYRDLEDQKDNVEALAKMPRELAHSSLRNQGHVIDLLESSARASDPVEMSKRGFSLIASETGRLINDIDLISVGQKIKGLIGRGSFVATVNEKAKQDNDTEQ